MASHTLAQRQFYQHLCMHPGAHAAASHFADKLVAKDPTAQQALKQLASRAATDTRAANALRIVAVTLKYEHSNSPIFAGGLPAIASAGGKVIKLALSPVAWAGNATGMAFKWAGSQLQHLSHAI